MTFTIARVRHELEVRLLTVRSAQPLSQTMRRITLSGPLDGFRSLAPDDHVKLIFPFPGTSEIDLPEVGPQGISRDVARPPMRDYTPRRFDADAGELVIDMVVHGDGPGATWAAGAAPGTTVGQVGPRGSAVLDGSPEWLLLAGDETALPSIARRLEESSPQVPCSVMVEVDGPGGELPLPAGDHVDVRWIHRGDGHPGDRLVRAVQALDLPAGDGFAWVAAEAGAARTLRAHLRDERGLAKHQTKVTGYWKLGTSDHHDPPDA